MERGRSINEPPLGWVCLICLLDLSEPRIFKVMSPWLFDRWCSCRTCVPDEQWKSRHIQLWHTEVTAAAAGYQGADHVSCMFGPSQEYDLPMWTWYMPDVWGPHVRVSNLSQAGWETHSPLLNLVKYKEYLHQDVKTVWLSSKAQACRCCFHVSALPAC